MIGMDSQSRDIFRSVASGSIQNVDISIDDIVGFMGTGSIFPSSDSPIDIEAEMAKIPDTELTPFSKYIIRAILNMVLKSDEHVDDIFTGSINPQLFDIILRKRNEHIVDTFLRASGKNTVFVYGSLHFSGIYTLLHDKNQNWKIISATPMYPYVY